MKNCELKLTFLVLAIAFANAQLSPSSSPSVPTSLSFGTSSSYLIGSYSIAFFSTQVTAQQQASTCGPSSYLIVKVGRPSGNVDVAVSFDTRFSSTSTVACPAGASSFNCGSLVNNALSTSSLEFYFSSPPSGFYYLAVRGIGFSNSVSFDISCASSIGNTFTPGSSRRLVFPAAWSSSQPLSYSSTMTRTNAFGAQCTVFPNGGCDNEKQFFRSFDSSTGRITWTAKDTACLISPAPLYQPNPLAPNLYTSPTYTLAAYNMTYSSNSFCTIDLVRQGCTITYQNNYCDFSAVWVIIVFAIILPILCCFGALACMCCWCQCCCWYDTCRGYGHRCLPCCFAAPMPPAQTVVTVVHTQQQPPQPYQQQPYQQPYQQQVAMSAYPQPYVQASGATPGYPAPQGYPAPGYPAPGYPAPGYPVPTSGYGQQQPVYAQAPPVYVTAAPPPPSFDTTPVAAAPPPQQAPPMYGYSQAPAAAQQQLPPTIGSSQPPAAIGPQMHAPGPRY